MHFRDYICYGHHTTDGLTIMLHRKEMARHVDAVLKALDILDSFINKPAATLKEIIDRTGLNRSRVMRLVGTLESRGYLSYDPENRTYQLGSRVMTLGKVFELNNNLLELSRPILKSLVKQTSEMASLYILDKFERVAIAREQGVHPIGYTRREGERMEVYVGAAGKALLAYASKDVRSHVVKKSYLRKLTSKTITSPKLLESELETIRLQGYAISKGERYEDVVSVAAPIFDFKNKVCAALGITGPKNRFNKTVIKRNIKYVREAARDLSNQLGFLETK